MEIQQHDGVVVDAAAILAGLRQALREGEVLQREREAPGAWVRSPPSPHLYIGPLGGRLKEICPRGNNKVIIYFLIS